MKETGEGKKNELDFLVLLILSLQDWVRCHLVFYNWKVQRNSGLTLSKATINLRVSSVVSIPELRNRTDIYFKKYF